MTWDNMLDEYLIATKGCIGAALASRTDYTLYAAAPVEPTNKGWDIMYKAPYKEKIPGAEEGQETEVDIDEAATLKETVETDIMVSGPAKLGLWLGGVRFRVVQREVEDNYIWVCAVNKDKQGAHILATQTQVLVTVYDEKVAGQKSGNCKSQAIQMIDYMISEGV